MRDPHKGSKILGTCQQGYGVCWGFGGVERSTETKHGKSCPRSNFEQALLPISKELGYELYIKIVALED